jgi:hypothetical protein
MAYLMLYGDGWTQRWRIADGDEDHVRSEISRVGTAATGEISVVDPGTEHQATLVVAWALVAAAVVLDAPPDSAHEDAGGQYA